MILARSLVAFWTAWSKHCSENEKIVHIDRMERSGDKGAVGVEGEEERREEERRGEKRRLRSDRLEKSIDKETCEQKQEKNASSTE
ncbi:hypothetical protein HZH66_002006 [Vespula vulgaris]|uniref:Uncharacterized protein n=1 Tax=Vespula vulgaris TaxID=7454 RepID=A0A834KGC1_VESVU|nr:hypothetical protein HZH66_002006 [Vespula vulgaris]